MGQGVIQSGLIGRVGEYLGTPCKAAIISDSTVMALWGERLMAPLREGGFDVCANSFPAGEAEKNLDTYGAILAFLANNHLGREDWVLALGGGVVGDLAGFAAATYLRGVRLAQIPTTLLAQVDAAFGGKTAIDLAQGKNLAGAFYPPHAVLCDPDTLSTLPYHEYQNGLAEIVKYAAIAGRDLYDLLPYEASEQEKVIRRCADIKLAIVAEDFLDKDGRQVLNFGHTFGHAVEKASGYTLPHGRAVAIGMAIMARACAALGICGRQDAGLLLNMLHLLGLPTQVSYGTDTLMDAALGDKKRRGERINLVLFGGMGNCFVKSVALEELRGFLHAGLAPW